MVDFPTTILTSKSPEDVANFLPRSLQLSQTLIEQNLVAWFSNYMNMLMRYNQDLNSLVANGRHFFTSAEGEFGAIDKIWNCVALCVMSQIHVNDSLLSTIRNDIVGPFNAAFKEDFKHSELQIESQELLQMVESLDDAEGTYNWNHKAPVILQNFENYKRFEKDTLFNAFIAYLNVVNSRNARLVSKNENAVNFILKEFNIDREMENYTDYMINTKVEAPPKPQVQKPVEKAPLSKTSSSITSGHSSGGKERRKSKLMLKVGSILGRKKKHGVSSHSETIPEDHSVVSATLSRQETQASRAETKNSLYQPAAPMNKLVRSNSASAHPIAATIPENVSDIGGAKKASRVLPSLNTQPLVPNNAAEKKLPTPQTPVKAPALIPAPLSSETHQSSDLYAADEGAPNVEKLESSDEDSDVPTDKSGNRMSLLKTHDLGNTPKLNTDPEEQARGASAGKYSFEYGDEEKSISTPTQTPKLASKGFDLQPESQPPVYDEDTAQPVLPEKHELKSEQRPPPPPPPSRKAHNTNIDAKRDIPTTNTSFSHAADGMSLRSQMTGASLLKQDYFKHFDTSDDISRPGLNSSIAEIINVNIVRGDVIKSQILGEIAFNYNSQEVSNSVAVKIPLKFSRFLLNEQIMQEGERGVYNLNVAPILGKTLGGIKYSLDINPHEVPILIKQIWKTEETQASLIVKVMLNPSYGQQIQLDNFVISASLDNSVTSTSASSKPEGSFNKDANRITWRYSKPLVLSASNPEEKLIARIMTNGVAKESSSGVKVKFSVALPPNSYAKIYDMDDNMIPSVINLSSGNYSSVFN